MVKGKGSSSAILQNHQENMNSECVPVKHSYSNSELNSALFALYKSVTTAPAMVSSHHSSPSYFSELHLDTIL